ncbi:MULTISPECIES: hypothetical protein [unclassified Rathayibacter]|uniref:hypothetical protein n=1 Tax=unclassified Rathayibacter TaxID=2609250 RepID=UPI00188D1D2F|nr:MULTISPECIES: hypothetical protein [unclassified Rathayibacter]MBF4461163.1 hypothetical protein [Rathayibacter sp. VKM Ac-2879]MBF4502574.1 hypothetical protein [Rathayibacter sp. VKM Ac-2878]
MTTTSDSWNLAARAAAPERFSALPSASLRSSAASGRAAALSDRIDRSLLALHSLPGLDARAIARSLGVSLAAVRVAHWMHRRCSIRSALARTRVDTAHRYLHAEASNLPQPLLMSRAAEVAGFPSIDAMDRAFLRYRHRSSYDVMLTSRAVRRGAA